MSVPEYPLVDGRRVSQLREVLLRDIASLAPDWRGAHEPQGPDRAVVEIAARLAEEATKRLDKTPERDTLAFLEMFDIAPPRPSAARGVAVFALKEDKSAPVTAPARTGIEIKTLAGEPFPFETTKDLRIQPARIDRLGTIDPAADKLELAPAQVTSFEPDLIPRPTYHLATSADAGAKIISIEPPVGILPGDLLRLTIADADPVFLEVAEFSDDGLASLKGPLSAGLSRDTVERVERMTRLDAFTMPDRQEHGLYIGDKDVLNVKEPAEITLRLSPGSIRAILSLNEVEFEIWGTRESPGEPEEEPCWHRLVPLAGASADLTLYKAWTGPVDEVELGDKKSRWIRIRPLGRIIPVNGTHPLTGEAAALEQVAIGIVTEEPEDATGDTVSQVAYNGTPLPITTAFLPFGSEPQRFDTFSLAAPEAFSKPDATATLNFALMDATLAAISAANRIDSDRHAYGIGRNGRLQVMNLTGDRALWREAGGPPEEEGSEVTLALDPGAGIAAYARSKAPSGAVKAQDVVIARTGSGGLISGLIEVARSAQASAETSVKVVSWIDLPDLPEDALADAEQPALTAVPVLRPDNAHYDGFLLAAASGGIHRLRLNKDAGALTSDWVRVAEPADLDLPENPVLIFIDGSVDRALDPSIQAGAYLTLDDTGALWILRIRLNGLLPGWQRLEDGNGDPICLAPGARPAALRLERAGNDRLLVAALPSGRTELNLWEFNFDTPITFHLDHGTGPAIDASAVMRLVLDLSDNPDNLPHLLAYQNQPGTGLALEWAPHTGQVSTNQPAQGMVLADPPAKASAAIFGPDADDPRGLIAFGADDQTLVRLPINPSAPLIEQADWIRAPQSSQPDAGDFGHILVERLLDGQSDRSIAEVPPFDQTQAGDDVLRLVTEETDWTVPVHVFRAKDPEENADFDPVAVVLTGSAHSTDGLPDGRLILVHPTNAPENYGFFTVAGTHAGNKVTVSAPAALEALMNGHNQADWQELDEVAAVTPATSFESVGTLVRIGTAEAEDLSLFETSEVALDAEVIDTQAQNRTFVLPGWGGAPPAVGSLVKIVSQNSTAEVFEVRSLSSNFSAPELSWEYFNGEGWKRLDRDFRDTTDDFSRSGKVSFVVPRDLSPVEIAGQEDYWIRVRLVGGDYGKPVYKVISNPPEQKVVVDTSDLRPPEVASVTAQVSLPPDHLPELVVARNNLRDLDQTSANRLKGARFAMFEGAFVAPLGAGGSRNILLGLTRPLEPGSASLFVRALDQDRSAKLILETLGPDNTWSRAPLSDEDPTAGLHRSGLLRFTVTDRAAQVLLFGKPLHWLRLHVEDLADWAPQITGIWLNGVDIVQAKTVRQELLASSAGEPNLKLTLQSPPVLANSLELRVRERLSEEEADALNADARDSETAAVLDNVPNLPGKWVLWRQVDSLQDRADARVYRLNPDGRLRFGDDRNGRIPPAGRDNIRAFRYLSGGQRVETSPFGDAGLTGSVEGVEMVLAPAPIAGGTHPAAPPELVARMPEVMRHAGHALSLADLEAMAYDADGEIVQARAFTPTEPGGKVRLIVLARGESRTPTYPLAQQENLRRVLSAKMSDAYPEICLEVRSAAFVAVEVTVTLIARPGKLAELETQAGTHLRTFLHAALGGPEYAGWPPGRGLWPTDIRRALGTIEALDRVANVQIVMPDGRSLGQVLPHEVITTASSRDVKILVKGKAEA